MPPSLGALTILRANKMSSGRIGQSSYDCDNEQHNPAVDPVDRWRSDAVERDLQPGVRVAQRLAAAAVD